MTDCSAHASGYRNNKSDNMIRYFGAISVKLYGKSHEYRETGKSSIINVIKLLRYKIVITFIFEISPRYTF